MLHSLFSIFILLAVSTTVSHCQSSLIINEDRPSLIDALLQIVWEPSGLIRFWTALDQLYNIGLSWRTVAKTVVTLPFREGRTMSHVRIQEPRRARGMIKFQSRNMDLNHLERFNKIYSAGSSQYEQHVAPPASYQRQVIPPPYMIQPQNMFPQSNVGDLNQIAAYLEKYNNFIEPLNEQTQFQKVPIHFQQLINREIASGSFRTQQKMQFVPESSDNIQVPFPFTGASVPNVNPEARLRTFLKLMKDLGEIHTNRVIFDEEVKEDLR